MAAAAWATWITKDDPPTDVLSVNEGCRPMYSAVASVLNPAVIRPLTSDSCNPASANALWAASA